MNRNNPIFYKALGQAKCMLSSRYRIIATLNQAIVKINLLEDKKKIAAETKEKIFVLGRLLRAFSTGKYRALPWKAAISITAATLYFINPADIVPDFIPFTGLVDDFGILVWTYNSLGSELDKFIDWEKSHFFQQ